MQTKLSDPVYLKKFYTVLGHQLAEVFGGVILGLTVPGVLYFMFNL
jgi:acid phosphatase family membrane protein YuiD